MKCKADSNSGRRAPGLRALGVFAAVWLNLALQPCAIAMEAGHDCPHCPPQHEQQMAGHHDHDTVQVKPLCDSLDRDCADLGDVSLDGRGGQPKLKSVAEAPVAIVPAFDVFDPVAAKAVIPPTGPPLRSGRSAPLHVLHCVYLK